ncbi:MAG: hypothetical protein E6J91_39425 [Deltaproteobacteria bacterium]|nr:MAG: hypothetical protein E6J91_39425 [Deltaproteobacteria bacterium]
MSGNVFRDEGCATADGTVNVNFDKLEGGAWTYWRARAVFPAQGDYSTSESNYHDFEIKPVPAPVPTETFLTLDSYQNGAPGTVSVSGHVFVAGGTTPATGTVNVNFDKLEGGAWTYKNTASRTLVNGYYEVLNWAVGVGQWRVRAVFPAQGNYASSASNYHEFSIQPVATNAFITINQVLPGQPGHVSVSGHVLRANGTPAMGTVNVNFDKVESGSWTYKDTASRTLVNGYYEVLNWAVGVGQWRVRAVFPAQGDYSGSESDYHEFVVNAR